MKKALLLLFVSISLLCICGCTKKEVIDIPMAYEVDGWVSSGKGELTDNLRKLFDEAMNGSTAYIPVKIQAQQPVSGISYMFICKGNDPTVLETKYYSMIIHEDIDGNVSLKSKDLLNNNFVGGYHIVEDGTLNEELMIIWNDANKRGIKREGENAIAKTGGVLNNFLPIVLQATQLSNGKNYNFMAIVENGQEKGNLKDIIINVDPGGKAYVSDIKARGE